VPSAHGDGVSSPKETPKVPSHHDTNNVWKWIVNIYRNPIKAVTTGRLGLSLDVIYNVRSVKMFDEIIIKLKKLI